MVTRKDEGIAAGYQDAIIHELLPQTDRALWDRGHLACASS